MIAALLRSAERRDAGLLSIVEFSTGNPHECEIQRQYALDQRVAALSGDQECSLESFDSALIVTELGVKHPEIIEHPRNSLVVIRSFECSEAVWVTCFGGDEVAAHVEQHTAILIDHSH